MVSRTWFIYKLIIFNMTAYLVNKFLKTVKPDDSSQIILGCLLSTVHWFKFNDRWYKPLSCKTQMSFVTRIIYNWLRISTWAHNWCHRAALSPLQVISYQEDACKSPCSILTLINWTWSYIKCTIHTLQYTGWPDRAIFRKCVKSVEKRSDPSILD